MMSWEDRGLCEGYNVPFNGSLGVIQEETVENTVGEIAMEIDSERNLSAHAWFDC